MTAMIQSTANSSTQASYGFENLTRFAVQASKPTGGGSRSGSSDRLSGSSSDKTNQLTPEQLRQVEQLKQTDTKVHQHEQAHLATGRDLVTGGPTYTYTIGPDKQRYAVAGEVSIDTSPGKTPQETIPKAEHIRATALAPVDPSAQDRSVAAKASGMEREARIELATQNEGSSSQASNSARLYQSAGVQNQLGLRLDFFA